MGFFDILCISFTLNSVLVRNRAFPGTVQRFKSEGFNIIENLYAVPNSTSTFAFYDSQGSGYLNANLFLGSEYMEVSPSINVVFKYLSVQTDIAVLKNLNLFNNTSIILFDSITHFMSNFFHFLEHIVSIFMLLVSQNIPLWSVKRIIFPNIVRSIAIEKHNSLNKELLDILFPGIEIFCQEEWQKLGNDMSTGIRFALAVTSDRSATTMSNLTLEWNKMMVI